MAGEAKGGYSYAVSEEQIIEWLAVPVAEKLRWVENMNRLAYELRTEEAREIAEMFRRGAI
ncbi:MAG: hypothetical protein QME96_13795 [Myxococcota bacterium]|nr:hypothetical protein [Myxococcota bacterium]